MAFQDFALNANNIEPTLKVHAVTMEVQMFKN
jgi:hypothetical protein